MGDCQLRSVARWVLTISCNRGSADLATFREGAVRVAEQQTVTGSGSLGHLRATFPFVRLPPRTESGRCRCLDIHSPRRAPRVSAGRTDVHRHVHADEFYFITAEDEVTTSRASIATTNPGTYATRTTPCACNHTTQRQPPQSLNPRLCGAAHESLYVCLCCVCVRSVCPSPSARQLARGPSAGH